MDRLTRLFVACACVTAAACQNPDAILLTVGADAAVEQYDLYVRDERTKEIIFHSTFNPVAKPGEAPRDLRTDKLKLAIKLSRPGDFKLLLVGVIGAVENGGKPAIGSTQLFWAGRVKVQGTTNVDARLLTVPDGNDTDRDLWPDRDTWLASNAEAANLYRGQESLLDCNDKMANPLNSEGMMLSLEPSQVNPFAKEVCTEKYDRDCDGMIEPCVDEDGDGDFAGSDCDDKDPARHHPTAADPYPDPPNCCGYSLGKTGDEAKMNFLGQPICPTQRCGDGVDQSCSGRDTTCVVDADCDGVPAPPMGNDCDDNDPNTFPGALEPCGSTKDLNCSGKVNDGCVPCDLDGDGFQRMDATNGCPDANNNGKPIDCNDYDAGIFPGQSSAKLNGIMPTGMTEAGTDQTSRVVAALRGNCRRVYQPTGTTGTAKIGITGFAVGDADCNGTAFEGCPPVSCDADGDGWPNANTTLCNPGGMLALDCNDNDPTVFPGAPDKCGNGIAENCTADVACANDADGDGYPASVDCNDQNRNIHPWAVELCNGVDDDCDGFIDEGNPDPSGAPLVATGAITACTTSDIGECGKTKGLCVCSVANNNATPDPQNRRTWCPGEQGATAGSRFAQCYGAGQPKPQTCDATNKKDDDCDGRNDDPTGTNIGALKGMACGFNQGQCKQGTVTGCDYGRDNAYFTFGLTAAPGGTAATRGYVCSSDTVNPSTEVCDGIDNDCKNDLKTNTLPDERDRDLDGWLACSPFVGTANPPTLNGGGDCNDSVASTYPGAPELCDNVDNNCSNGVADDGTGQCGMGAFGALPNCCSSQAACRNLSNDFNNCTTCGSPCSSLTANNCGMGGSGCRCGNSPACSLGSGQTPGAWCNSGSCETCNTKQHCGASCVDCGTNVCKPDGSGCTECNTDNDCPANKWCNSGVCANDFAPGATCSRPEQCPTAAPNCIDTGPGTKVCCAQATCGTCSTCATGTCQNASPGSTQPGCMGVNVCNNGACGLAVGQPCSSGGCAFGNCIDGVCCASSCTGSCQRCAMGTGLCGSVVNAVDPDTCDSSGTRICNGSGVCKKVNGQDCTVPMASDCLTGNCVDGKCCDQTAAFCGTCRTCNGSTPGTCQAVTNMSQDTECDTAGYSCDGSNNGANACVRDAGVACSGASQCRSGICSTNCCATSCAPSSCNDTVAPAQTTTFTGCAASTGACQSTSGTCANNFGCTGVGSGCMNSCTNGSTAGCTAGYCCKTGACVDLTLNTSCGSTCATCSGGTPKCSRTAASTYQCKECNTDADCPGSKYCDKDNTCKSVTLMAGDACSTANCAFATSGACKQCPMNNACGGGGTCP